MVKIVFTPFIRSFIHSSYDDHDDDDSRVLFFVLFFATTALGHFILGECLLLPSRKEMHHHVSLGSKFLV